MLKTMRRISAVLCMTAVCCLMIPTWTALAVTSDDQTVAIGSVASNESLMSYYQGDVNGDWTLSTTDARTILMDVLNEDDITYQAVADYDQNGVLNTTDARTLLQNVLNGAAPVLVSPSAEVITGFMSIPTSGVDIDFTQAASVEVWDSDVANDECYIVQSLDELKAFYAADEDCADYTASFSEEFFRTNALVFVKVCASYSPKIISVDQMKIDGNVLNMRLWEECPVEKSPITYGERILLTVAKEDIANVTAIRVYEFKNIHYELL